jgi:hypothetical protein
LQVGAFEAGFVEVKGLRRGKLHAAAGIFPRSGQGGQQAMVRTDMAPRSERCTP